MGGDVLLGVGQPTQIEDVFDACFFRGLGKIARAIKLELEAGTDW